MHSDFERLRSEARGLDSDDRAQLALDLLESLDAAFPSPSTERAWNDEAVRRLAEYDRGEVKGVSVEQVHADVEAILRR